MAQNSENLSVSTSVMVNIIVTDAAPFPSDTESIIVTLLCYGFVVNLVCCPAANYTVELLSLHDCELLKVKEFYEKARPLLESIEKWQKNWALFLDFEVWNFRICHLIIFA